MNFNSIFQKLIIYNIKIIIIYKNLNEMYYNNSCNVIKCNKKIIIIFNIDINK